MLKPSPFTPLVTLRLGQILAEPAAGVVMGDGVSEATELGPIDNREQLDRVTELVQGAVAGGLEVSTGASPIDGPVSSTSRPCRPGPTRASTRSSSGRCCRC